MTSYRHSKPAALLYFFALMLLGINAPARAQDIKALPSPAVAAAPAEAVIFTTDFVKLESLGLYGKTDEDSLGEELWKGSRRSEIVKLLKDTPVSSEDPAVQKMIFGLLLTGPDAALIENDVPPQAGEDLFTLRIAKLLQAGAYKKAYDMYTLLDEPAYAPELARLGIMTMLYNGQKSTACLEVNTAVQPEDTAGFWDIMRAYCDVSLSGDMEGESADILKATGNTILYPLATQEDYYLRYTPEKFAALSELGKALLISEQRLDITDLDSIDPESIPPEQIEALLVQKDLSERQRMALTVQAVRWGLKTPGDLKKLYTPKPHSPEALIDEDAPPPPVPQENWAKPAYYYQQALRVKEDDAAKWDMIRKAYDSVTPHSRAALTPFAGIVDDIRLETPGIDDIEIAYNIFAAAGQAIPPYWADSIKNIPEEQSLNKKHLPLAVTGLLSLPDQSSENAYKIALSNKIGDSEGSSQFFFKKVIENVDNNTPNSNNALKAYEKDMGLTFGEDYVMPLGDVWDRLMQASDRGAIGETVLLGRALIQGQRLQDLHPALVVILRQSLKNVGLTNISRDMATEVSLGYIKN